jgi:hypothetical protein
MPASFSPAFIGLSEGSGSLSSLNANIGDAGKVIQGLVNDTLTSYVVTQSSAASSPPGLIRPANFDEEKNPVVFVQVA